MELVNACEVPPATVYPKKYAYGFVVLCFVVVMQSFIMNSHEVFIHIHQRCFAGTGAIVRLPQCQWSKPDGYGKISQCITTTKHSKAKNRVHISWDILYWATQMLTNVANWIHSSREHTIKCLWWVRTRIGSILVCLSFLVVYWVIAIDQIHKSHTTSVPYPKMHHQVRKCANFCSEWSFVGYLTGAL